MSETARSLEEDGQNLTIQMLPEIKHRVVEEADRRARSYPGATPGEKKSRGSYLGTVALLHFLRLPVEERKAIYAEMRSVMDARLEADEEDPLDLPPYRGRGTAPMEGTAPLEDFTPETGVGRRKNGRASGRTA